MYESVAKLPCGEVTVAKLPCGEVTGNHLRLTSTSLLVLRIFQVFQPLARMG